MMGCNYYFKTEPCHTCGKNEFSHIGKSSAGWTFLFQANDKIRSYKDVLAKLELGGTIEDEYGKVLSLEEFKELVQSKVSEPRNHAKEYTDPENFLDPECHAFSEFDFT
jgi:hypothetical protein